MTRPLAILLGLLAVLAAGCGKRPGDLPAPVVLVEVAPLVSLVEPLVGEGVVVRTIVPPGASAHGYQISPAQARDIAKAGMVVLVGPVLDPGIARAVRRLAPEERIFEIGARLGIEPEEHDHDHGDHDHDHDHHHGPDPHLWLDPDLMDRMLDYLPGALAARGLSAPDAEAAVAGVRAEIAGVRDAYAERLAPFAGRAIITHHDAFRRIADRHGLTIAQVVRPVAAVEPTPGDLDRVLAAARAHGVGAIFVEPQFPDALPRRIAERLGIGVHVLDPEGSTDWAGMMMGNLEALEAGLSRPAPGGPGAGG